MKKVIKISIVVFLSLFLAVTFGNIINPKIQVFVDISNYNEKNSVVVGNYKDGLADYELDSNNNVFVKTNIKNKEYIITFNVNNNKISDIKVNGEKFDKVEKISDYTTYNAYQDTYCLKINAVTYMHYVLIVLLFVIFMFLLYLSSKSLFKKEKYNHKLIYSGSSIKIIGLKPIVISFVVTIISLVLYCGCDLCVISETIILHMKGVDFYQLFSTLNEYKGVTLLMWQYDGAMLAGYSLPSYLTYFTLKFFNPLKYHWIQVILYKLFNMLLCNAVVLSLISFLIDKKILDKTKAKKLYYISIFNPVTFYVAIWFIQFDILPAYLLLLGILLMDNLEENKFISAFLIAFALSCKMTMWMFIPAIGILMLFVLIKNKSFKDSIIHGLVIFFVLCIMLLSTRILHSPIASALSGLAQSERMWYTIIVYLQALLLYVSVFTIIVSFALIYHDISSKISITNMIMITILSFGVTTMAFSFSTVATPSFWLQTMGAFIIIFALIDDDLTLFLTICFASLIIIQFACLPEGDITASLIFIGKEPIFTHIVNNIEDANGVIKYHSILFTVSQSIMFIFMFVFGKYINVLKRN